MRCLKVLLLSLSVISCVLISSIFAQKRILSGVATTIANVPYIVNLRKNGNFFCGGSLVSLRYVVTAAHCVHGVARTSLSVHAGASRLSQNGVTRTVSKITLPRNWNSRTMTHDVAVLQLTNPMPSDNSNIKTINLSSDPLKVGMRIKVSGWGIVREGSSTSSDILRMVNVPIKGKRACQKRYRSVQTLTRTMFCASGINKKDSCSGDSGGPAVCPNGELCGVVSWGVGCGRAGFPGIYTNIRLVRQFIQNAMQ